MISISQLNTSSKSDFDAQTDLLFEHAPRLSELLYSHRPFQSHDELINQAEALLATLPLDDLLSILNAHPQIGTPSAKLSSLSAAEQGKSGCASDEELQFVSARLKELNRDYEQKFGFKFVIFVNGRSRKDLIAPFEQRLANSSKDAEMWHGLHDMMEISRSRLNKLRENKSVL